MIHRVVNFFRQAFPSAPTDSSVSSRKRRHDDDGLNTPGLPSYNYKMQRMTSADEPSGSSTPTTRGEWKVPHKRPISNLFTFKKSGQKKENITEPDVIVLDDAMPIKSQSGIGMAGPSRTRLLKQQENMPLQANFGSKAKEKEVQIIEKETFTKPIASTSMEPALRDIQSAWVMPKKCPGTRFQMHRGFNVSKQLRAKSILKPKFAEGIRKHNLRKSSALQNCYKYDEKNRYQAMLSQFLQYCPFKEKKQLSITFGNTQLEEKSVELVDLTLSEDKLDTGKTISVTKFESPAKGTPHIIVPVISSTEDDEIQLLSEVPRKNSLEQILKSKPSFSDEWLQETVSKFKENQQLREEEVRKTKSRLELLEEKGKSEFDDKYVAKIEKQIKLFDISKEEEEIEEEEEEELFPPLSDEAEDMVDQALIPNPKNEVLAKSLSQNITRHDISTLSGLSWLNDEIINFYLDLVVQRGKQDNYPSVHAFNTFFYPKVMSQGYAPVKRWTKKVDIFSFDFLLVPVHLGMHWCMVIMDMASKTITYYDSLGGSDRGGLKKMKEYLCEESLDKKNKPFDDSGWKLIVASDIPHQMNGSDCGMFSCMFAETVSRRKPIKFTQDQMPYFRRRMVYEIITKKLMQ